MDLIERRQIIRKHLLRRHLTALRQALKQMPLIPESSPGGGLGQCTLAGTPLLSAIGPGPYTPERRGVLAAPNDKWTCRELGALFGVSGARIQQIEHSARRRIAKRAPHLREHLDR